MSCCSNCSTDPCSCGIPSNCNACECPDPGSLSTLRHITGLDYALCTKRLTNSNGILVNNTTGSGAGSISWSNNPCYLPDIVEISEGAAFGNIIANLGDEGCQRRIVPADAADGFLRALNGEWVIADLPNATVPDPLTLANLAVTDTATLVNLALTGSFCFPSVAEGTIATVVGLNSTGCMVKQAASGTSSFGTSIALYYENATEQSTAVPNDTIANGGYATIGNELYDANNIAQVQDQFTIKVLSAGSYAVIWGGVFATPSSQRDVNLNLEINGATVYPAFGPGRSNNSSPQVRATVFGFTFRALAVNDTIKLKCESSEATNNKLQKVKMGLMRVSA